MTDDQVETPRETGALTAALCPECGAALFGLLVETSTVAVRQGVEDERPVLVVQHELGELDVSLMTVCSGCHKVGGRDTADWMWPDDLGIDSSDWDLVPPVDAIVPAVALSREPDSDFDEDEDEDDLAAGEAEDDRHLAELRARRWEPERELTPEQIDSFAARLLEDPGFLAARTRAEMREAAEKVDMALGGNSWRPIHRALEMRRPALVEELAPTLAADSRFRAAKGGARADIAHEMFPEHRDCPDGHRLFWALVDRAVEIIDGELTPVVADLKDQGMTNIAIGVRLDISDKRVAKLLARAREGK